MLRHGWTAMHGSKGFMIRDWSQPYSFKKYNMMNSTWRNSPTAWIILKTPTYWNSLSMLITTIKNV